MSVRVLSIDPGKLQCGWGLFEDKRLVACGLSRNPVHKPGASGPDVWYATAAQVHSDVFEPTRAEMVGVDILVLEVPQVYRQKFQKGDQADLIELAGVDGCLRAFFRVFKRTVAYRPAEWKGQVPKDIHNRRVLAKLTIEEREDVFARDTADVPASLLNNTVDAVGLGLFFLGRME